MLLIPTLMVRAVTLLKIPMIAAVRPRVIELDDHGCAVEIPYRRFVSNHVNIMYFGALCVAADLGAGLNAARLIWKKYRGVELLFKDMSAQFVKRADGNVVMRCTQGAEIEEGVRRAYETGERVNVPLKLVATVPSKYGDEPIAHFTMSLTLKKK